MAGVTRVPSAAPTRWIAAPGPSPAPGAAAPADRYEGPRSSAPAPTPAPAPAGFFTRLGARLVDGAHAALGFVTGLVGGSGGSDRPNDGKRVAIDVPGAERPGDRVIYVGGALQNLAAATDGARALGARVKRDVLLVHNATEVRQYDDPVLRQLARAGDAKKDERQIVDDHYGRGQNPAVEGVREEVLARLRSGRPVEVAGYSQGATIAARALREATAIRRDELVARHGAAEGERRLTAELASIKVLNLAGTARRADFPAGVAYSHAELPGDPVPTTLGERSGPRRDEGFDARLTLLGPRLALATAPHALGAILGAHGGRLDAYF